MPDKVEGCKDQLKVIKAADKAYGEGMVLQAMKAGDDCGDGLAVFVYNEILSVWDPQFSYEDNVQLVVNAMNTAMRQLGHVASDVEELIS